MAVLQKVFKMPVNLIKNTASDLKQQVDFSSFKKRAASVALGGPLGYWAGKQIDKYKPTISNNIKTNKEKTDKFKNIYDKNKKSEKETTPSDKKKEITNTGIAKDSIPDKYKKDEEKIGLTNRLLVKEIQEISNLKEVEKRENGILVEQKNLLSDIKGLLKANQLKTPNYKDIVKDLKEIAKQTNQPSTQLANTNINQKKINKMDNLAMESNELTLKYNQNMIEEMRNMNKQMHKTLSKDPDKNMFSAFGDWLLDNLKTVVKKHITPKAIMKKMLIGGDSKAEKSLGLSTEDDYYDKSIKIQKQTYFKIYDILEVVKAIADTVGAEVDLSDTNRRGGIITYINKKINQYKERKSELALSKKQRGKLDKYKDTLSNEKTINEDYQYYLDNKDKFSEDEQKEIEKQYKKGKKRLENQKDVYAGQQQNTLLTTNIDDLKNIIIKDNRDNKDIQKNILNGMIRGIDNLLNNVTSLNQNQKLTLYGIQDGFDKLINMKNNDKFETILFDKIDNIYNQLVMMDLKSLNNKSINRSLKNIESSNSLDLFNFKNLLIPKKQKDVLDVSSNENITGDKDNKILDKIDISNSYLYKIYTAITECCERNFELQTKSITQTYLENREKEENEKREEKRFDNINDLLKDIKDNTKKSIFSKLGGLLTNALKFLPALLPFLIPGPGSIWDIRNKIKGLFGGDDKKGILPDTNIFSEETKETFTDKIKAFLYKHLIEPFKPMGTWLKTNLIDPLWKMLKPSAEFINNTFIQPLLDILKPVFEKSIKPITDKIGDFLQDLWEDIKLNKDVILNSMGRVLTKVGITLIEALPNLLRFVFLNPMVIGIGIRAISSWLIKRKAGDFLGEKVLDPFMGLISKGFKKGFSLLDDKLFSGKIKGILGNQMSNAFTKTMQITGTITTTIGTAVNKMAIGMGGLITSMASKTNEMLRNVIGSFSTKKSGSIDFSKISSSISSMISKSKTFISNISSWFIGPNGIINKLGGKLFGKGGILDSKKLLSGITSLASKSKSFISKLSGWFVGDNGIFTMLGGKLFGAKGLFTKGGQWLSKLSTNISTKILPSISGWVGDIFGKLSGVISGVFAGGGVMTTIGSALLAALTSPAGLIVAIGAGIAAAGWGISKLITNSIKKQVEEEIDYFDPDLDFDISLEGVRDIISKKHKDIADKATDIMDDIIAVLMNINDIVNEKEQNLLLKQSLEGLEVYNKEFLTNAIPVLQHRGYIGENQSEEFKSLLQNEDINNQIMGQISLRTIKKIQDNTEMIEYPNTGMDMPVNAAYKYWLQSDDNDFSIKYRNRLEEEYDGSVEAALEKNDPIITMAPFAFLARFKNEKLNDVMQNALEQNLDIVKGFETEIGNEQLNQEITSKNMIESNIVPTLEDITQSDFVNSDKTMEELIKQQSQTVSGGVGSFYETAIKSQLSPNEIDYTMGRLKGSALTENRNLFSEDELVQIQLMNTSSAELGFERILDKYIKNMENQINNDDKEYYKTLLEFNNKKLIDHFTKEGTLEENDNGEKIVLLKDKKGNIYDIVELESINKLLTLQGISKDKELRKKLLLQPKETKDIVQNFEYEIPKIKKQQITKTNEITKQKQNLNSYYTENAYSEVVNENTKEENKSVINSISETLANLINNTNNIDDLRNKAVEAQIAPRAKKALFELLGIEDEIMNGEIEVPENLKNIIENILNMPSEVELLPTIMNKVEEKVKNKKGLNYKDKLEMLEDISNDESILSNIAEKGKEGWNLVSSKAKEYAEATKDWTLSNINKWREEGTLEEKAMEFKEEHPAFASSLNAFLDGFKDMGNDIVNTLKGVKESVDDTTEAVVEGTKSEEETNQQADEYENTWWDTIKGSIEGVKDFIQSNDFITILAKGYQKGQELLSGMFNSFADILDLMFGKDTRKKPIEETNKTKAAEVNEARANAMEEERTSNTSSRKVSDDLLRELYDQGMDNKEWAQFKKDNDVSQLEQEYYNKTDSKTTFWEKTKEVGSKAVDTIKGWLDKGKDALTGGGNDTTTNINNNISKEQQLINLLDSNPTPEDVMRQFDTSTYLSLDQSKIPLKYDYLYWGYDSQVIKNLANTQYKNRISEIEKYSDDDEYLNNALSHAKKRIRDEEGFINTAQSILDTAISQGESEKTLNRIHNMIEDRDTWLNINNRIKKVLEFRLKMNDEEERKKLFEQLKSMSKSPMETIKGLFNNVPPETNNDIVHSPEETPESIANESKETKKQTVDINFDDAPITSYSDTTLSNNTSDYGYTPPSSLISSGYDNNYGITPEIYDMTKYEAGKQRIQDSTKDLMNKFMNLFKNPESPEEQASGYFDPFSNSEKVQFNFDRMLNLLNMKDIMGMMQSNNNGQQIERLVNAAEKTYQELSEIKNTNNSMIINNPVSVTSNNGGNSVSNSGSTSDARPLAGNQNGYTFTPIMERAFTRSHEI